MLYSKSLGNGTTPPKHFSKNAFGRHGLKKTIIDGTSLNRPIMDYQRKDMKWNYERQAECMEWHFLFMVTPIHVLRIIMFTHMSTNCNVFIARIVVTKWPLWFTFPFYKKSVPLYGSSNFPLLGLVYFELLKFTFHDTFAWTVIS